MRLFIDDIREMPEGFDLCARTYEAAMTFILTGNITHISFDHDLGEEKTGYDIISNIERQVGKGGWWFDIPTFSIHSANVVGRKNIQAAIDSIDRMR